jgi:hypothetical protein
MPISLSAFFFLSSVGSMALGILQLDGFFYLTSVRGGAVA